MKLISQWVVLALIIILSPIALGLETETKAAQAAIEPEQIVRNKSLAVHLGLTSDEVVFSAPRNFRSEQINMIRLEEIDPSETASAETE